MIVTGFGNVAGEVRYSGCDKSLGPASLAGSGMW